MKYVVILPLLLVSALMWGQDIDNKRMKRDIEVAENILDALLSEEKAAGFSSHQVEGTYLDSYGILFTIKNNFGGLSVVPAKVWDQALRNSGDREVRGNVQINKYGNVIAIGQDSAIATSTLSMDNFKLIAETFLADYGHLLTQLPNNERICLKYANRGGFDYSFDLFPAAQVGEKSSVPGFTAVTSKQAIEDYRTGKTDRKGLAAKVEYSETKNVNPEIDRDLILLRSIFNRLYQGDLSEGFFMRGQGQMEKIAGLGALFSFSFSTRKDGGVFLKNFGSYDILLNGYGVKLSEDEAKARAKSLGSTGRAKNDEEEDNEPEPDFNEFLQNFKSNVIEYGSTVRNLKPEEVLSFQLSLPSCDDCDDRPENVKIIAQQTLLEKYRTGKISLEAAIDQLQVTKY